MRVSDVAILALFLQHHNDCGSRTIVVTNIMFYSFAILENSQENTHMVKVSIYNTWLTFCMSLF